MRAKLSKEGGVYDLYRIDEDGKRVTFASTQYYKQKLSLKNCQAIERGYDLDELAREITDKEHLLATQYSKGFEKGIVVGFQKALEILGDKKFTISDLKKAMDMSRVIIDGKYTHSGEEIYQSLQQNEWDVEVEMCIEYTEGGYPVRSNTPKLDAENCLILKRV